MKIWCFSFSRNSPVNNRRKISYFSKIMQDIPPKRANRSLFTWNPTLTWSKVALLNHVEPPCVKLYKFSQFLFSVEKILDLIDQTLGLIHGRIELNGFVQVNQSLLINRLDFGHCATGMLSDHGVYISGWIDGDNKRIWSLVVSASDSCSYRVYRCNLQEEEGNCCKSIRRRSRR